MLATQFGMSYHDLVAYFSAEFGLHKGFPIYSGGLGILAGDHCKAASDLGLPLVAVGLLYHQGYFTQTIDADGAQHAAYMPSDFTELPVSPALDPGGRELRVVVPIAERLVSSRVWNARAERVRVLLLDTDVAENSEHDRRITYQLYGGDVEMRIKQELVLGVGGVRALRAADLHPTAWHINEGHAAFSTLERCRELVAGGLDFPSALEACAASCVFTTHTAVPAGHDVFPPALIERYLSHFCGALGLAAADLHALGLKPDQGDGFNQTALAIRGSRFQNGVSRIHRDVSAQLCRSLWPQGPPLENPVSYVTNGVHVGTFLAPEWATLFDAQFGSEWRGQLTAVDFWDRIERIPDELFWNTRQWIKARLLADLRRRLTQQYTRNGMDAGLLERALRHLDPGDPNVLLIGFARRFATYKRAGLLFEDPARAAALCNAADRPVVFVFAGKAHPADLPAQALIQSIWRWSQSPQFEGKVLLVEGYDMALARSMVRGADAWLNTPEYPFEASGTSGQKAGMNAGINVSVLDGWWGEGFDGSNGWAIKPVAPIGDSARRDRAEAAQLYDILEKEVVPLYYERTASGFSRGWLEKAKRSMKTLLPRFSAARMVEQYVTGFYRPASVHGRQLAQDGFQPARSLARWKALVRERWPGVAIRRISDQPFEVALTLNGLSPADVRVDGLVGERSITLDDAGAVDGGDERRFALSLRPDEFGAAPLRVRAYPYSKLLAHRFELGLMLWL